ncbi:hypothetical protein E2C01_061209 [Portunus trituberculatus]|uniref:Uncharacterized protein n=1 Tax=Portunus trituberculatus TaxID=210409 RepID=A0A5B7HCJ8_PORTR|nr:hypothetical protein [Portunus trituberculatus]
MVDVLISLLQKLFKFKEANAIPRAAVLNAQIKYEENLIQIRATRPKLFHSYIRNRKLDRPRVGPLLVNGKLTDDPNFMVNVFVKAFSLVFVVESSLNPFSHQMFDQFWILRLQYGILDFWAKTGSWNLFNTGGQNRLPDCLIFHILISCPHYFCSS